MTHKGPKTWHTCGPISNEHAKNQFKAFGVVYMCNGVYLLDYDELSKPKEEIKVNPESRIEIKKNNDITKIREKVSNA